MKRGILEVAVLLSEIGTVQGHHDNMTQKGLSGAIEIGTRDYILWRKDFLFMNFTSWPVARCHLLCGFTYTDTI